MNLLKLFVILLCFSTANSFAARPLITDDARIIDPQSCQLESWAKASKNTEEYWALPACNPLGFFELTLGGSKFQGDDAVGSADRVIQAKTVFRQLKPNDWSIGLALGRASHLYKSEERHHDTYGYIPITWSFDDDQKFLHLNLGAVKRQFDPTLRKTWGLGAELEITPRTFLIGETFGVDGAKPSYQAGVRHWFIPNKFQVDLTTGSKSQYTSDSRWFSIGIRLPLGN
jgi:hypothetical protein